jgi:hypothetical protein
LSRIRFLISIQSSSVHKFPPWRRLFPPARKRELEVRDLAVPEFHGKKFQSGECRLMDFSRELEQFWQVYGPLH